MAKKSEGVGYLHMRVGHEESERERGESQSEPIRRHSFAFWLSAVLYAR